MSHFKTVWLILAFVLAASSIAMEQDTENMNDGNHLLPICQSAVDSMSRTTWSSTHESFAYGYCLGLTEGIGYASATVCLSDGVTIGQEVRVVSKYLNENPEKLNHDERILVDVALSKAFPCPVKPSKHQ